MLGSIKTPFFITYIDFNIALEYLKIHSYIKITTINITDDILSPSNKSLCLWAPMLSENMIAPPHTITTL